MLETYDESTTPANARRVSRAEGLAAVRFYYNEVYEQDHAEIKFPGNVTDVRDCRVTEELKLKYPLQWKAYKEGAESLMPELAGQTLCKDVAWIDGGMVKHLAALNILTIEQLANVGDHNLKNIGITARRMVQRAQEFLKDKAEDTSRQDQLEAENAELRTMMAEQQKQINALMEAQKPKRRGRPPKPKPEPE